ncbi:hypothetical protein O6H91_06G013300 [Diphasiastrum complanatum]|uniref:Uncharacterized protein n=3 Tax=Diphasiastrum complanatum TaxID=34168 RepID=A0ACC2DAR6_DIPCM|nr:hypothetical protein O6H91_06G013300 [Diphasiastrum complanatum]KAJ7551397.1 hypothetical protein O6H91_06G013300 [Diphasiastrum complanatum]
MLYNSLVGSPWLRISSFIWLGGGCQTAFQVLACVKYQHTQINVGKYVRELQICGKLKAYSKGKKIHSDLVKSGLESNKYVASTLVSMYAKCGSLADARQVFDRMHERDLVAWNAIIGAYAKQGQGREALVLCRQLKKEALKLDTVTFVSMLNACAGLATLEEGKSIHAEAVEAGYELDVYVGTALIDMYAKCGEVLRARNVFDRMLKKNVVSWNAMISGYAKQGSGNEVLRLCQQMKEQGFRPDGVTFVCMLNACATLEDIKHGKQVHEEAMQFGLASDVFVGTALVDMYAKCGSLFQARQIFDELPKKNVITWNAMIAGYGQVEYSEEVLNLWKKMKGQGIRPSGVTFVYMLNACASLGLVNQGRKFHHEAMEAGFVSNVFVGAALIDMYSKQGSLQLANQVFDRMPRRDVVVWNSLIAGYAKHENASEALRLFEEMKLQGLTPNAVTYVFMLNACASLENVEQGKQIHLDLIEAGFEKDVFVGSALVDMYAKCGSLQNSRHVFDGLLIKNVVSWNAMIAAHAKYGEADEVLKLWHQMKHDHVQPTGLTFVSVLNSCASLAALEQGKEVYIDILESSTEVDIFVEVALINMFSKCGSLDLAWTTFSCMSQRDVVSWNAIISGCSKYGNIIQAFQLFRQMQQEGLQPDEVTCLIVLSVCSHLGLLDEGCHLFYSMSRDHTVVVSLEHYNCMVDLFSRAGCLDIADDFVGECKKRMKLQN